MGGLEAWSWGEEKREKRRPIMFLIPDPSAWCVVVAAPLLRPGSNYQKMVRRTLNLLYHMNLHMIKLSSGKTLQPAAAMYILI